MSDRILDLCICIEQSAKNDYDGDEWPFVLGYVDKIKAESARLRYALKAAGAPTCCVCGLIGLSTVEDDGGDECQLDQGEWVCSESCWDTAVKRDVEQAVKNARQGP